MNSYVCALWLLNCSLIHFSFISAISSLFLLSLTSHQSIFPLFASYQSYMSAMGPLVRFNIPSCCEYLEYLFTALCHAFGFLLWLAFIMSLSKNSFAIFRKVSLVSSGVHSTSLVFIFSIMTSMALGLYFFILMPCICFHMSAYVNSHMLLAFTIQLSVIIESFFSYL